MIHGDTRIIKGDTRIIKGILGLLGGMLGVWTKAQMLLDSYAAKAVQ